MVTFTAVLAFTSLLALVTADGDAWRKDKGYYKVTPNSTLKSRDLLKRQCEGTCEECFGTGYTLCPGSDLYCYLPGDEYYGLDSCSSSSSDTTSAPEPTSTGSAGDSDFCSGTGATCTSCFGPGYLDCPDNYHCYNPDDPEYDTCPEDSGSSEIPSTSTCAELYGTGSIDCGTDSCYNPTEGDVCCADGYHCEDGDTCSTEVGYCCSPGSTSSGCSGSGLSSYSYTYSYSSSSYDSTSSADDFSFGATSTGGSDATETGVSQFGDASAASRGMEVKIVGVVLAMFGLVSIERLSKLELFEGEWTGTFTLKLCFFIFASKLPSILVLGFSSLLILQHLRRSALRLLSSPSSIVSRPRAISSISSFSIRTHPAARTVTFQRRWVTNEAEAREEKEKVDDLPVSQLQPTPEEEVENAIHEDEVVEATSAEAPATAELAESTASETAVPRAETSRFDTAAATRPSEGRSAFPENNSDKRNEPKPTVYVGNLFFDITEEDLQQEFGRFGTIEKVKLLRDSRGLSKGFGYIDFTSTEAATAAIQGMHQQLYEGRRAVVQYAAYTSKDMDTYRRNGQHGGRPAQNPPSKTLFVGNLSYEMTDRDMNNLFKGIKNVIDVRVAIDRRTGQARGFAHADFIDVKSAMEAAKVLAEKETYGRKLRIDYSFGPSTAPRNQDPPQV